MPCDTIQTNSVNLGNLGDRAMLARALTAVGLKNIETHADGRITFGTYGNGGTIYNNGQMDLRGPAANVDVNGIKRAYSTEAVKVAAEKFGWNLKPVSATRFQAVRKF